VSALDKAHRLLAPRVAYLIGTRSAGGTGNLIPVSNVTAISTNPQQVCVAVYNQWETQSNLLTAEGFTLSVPHMDQLDGVWKLGAKYSRYQYQSNAHKFAESLLTIDESVCAYGPIVPDAIGWMSLRILQHLDFQGDHTLFIAQVEAVTFNAAYVNADGTPGAEVRPVMQITGNTFTTGADTITLPYAEYS